jgi:hypothetical protein
VISFDQTQAHTIVGRTPLDEGSARRRDHYLTTHSQETNIHAAGGIRTHDPSKCSATDLSLRSRGRWYRLFPMTRCLIRNRANFNIYTEESKMHHLWTKFCNITVQYKGKEGNVFPAHAIKAYLASTVGASRRRVVKITSRERT